MAAMPTQYHKQHILTNEENGIAADGCKINSESLSGHHGRPTTTVNTTAITATAAVAATSTTPGPKRIPFQLNVNVFIQTHAANGTSKYLFLFCQSHGTSQEESAHG